ncbi:MAG: C39 family peptidase, partial [Planctomycetales bacterium]
MRLRDSYGLPVGRGETKFSDVSVPEPHGGVGLATFPRRLVGSWAVLAIGACGILAAEVPRSSQPARRSVLIKDVPHVRQKPDFCGEACVAMYLNKLGVQADQDYVYDQSGLSPVHGRGCYTRELTAALKRIGFRVGSGGTKVSAQNSAAELNAAFGDLHADLAKGIPSIACMHYDDQPNTTEHFRLILGYDAATDEVVYHEPARAEGKYRRMKRAMFLKLWPLKYDAKEWTVIRLRLEPGRIANSPPSA